MSLTIKAAQVLRDGGIDAVAALNESLIEVLTNLPTEMHSEIKLAIGRAMSTVIDETINRAIASHSELEPDEETWLAVVVVQARKRADT